MNCLCFVVALVGVAQATPGFQELRSTPEQNAYDLVQRAAFQRLQRNGVLRLDPYFELIESYLSDNREEAFRPTAPPPAADALYLWLDVDAASSQPRDRLEAALRFPRDREEAKALFHQKKKTLGGSLPWELERAVEGLTQAFQKGDRERIGLFAAQTLRIVSHAALPFSTTSAADDDSSGTLVISTTTDKDQALARCATVKGRTQDWPLLYLRADVEEALSGSTRSCPTIGKPADAAFELLLESSATLDALRATDAELRNLWAIREGAKFHAVADTFLTRLSRESLPLLIDRMDQAACLAAVLLYQASQDDGGQRSGMTASLPPSVQTKGGASNSSGTDASTAKSAPETPSGQTTQQSTGSNGKFVGSRNSDKVHRPDCYFVARISPQNLVYFSTVGEARQQGRGPCSRCNPVD